MNWHFAALTSIFQTNYLSFVARSPALQKILRDSWIIFYQTFHVLEFGTLFPARECLVSDIPAGDGNPLNLYLQCVDCSATYIQSLVC